MKTILSSEYLKETIYHHLIDENNGLGSSGTTLISLNNLLQGDHVAINEEALMLQVQHKLLAKKECFPLYQAMFVYPYFINEVITFAKELILWNIDPNSLPKDTDSEKELANILSELMDMDCLENYIQKHFESLLSKAKQIEDLTIYPFFETDYFRYVFLQKILEDSSKKQISFATNVKDISLYYASSTRQEIEAIAQDICSKNEPCNIVLCNYSEYLPVLKQVFTRYNIPYYPYKEHEVINIPQAFTALVRFALYKTNDYFVTALLRNGFDQHIDDDAIQYFNSHPDSFKGKIEEVHLSSFEHDEKKLNKAIKHCDIFLHAIQDKLDLLLNVSTPKEALESAYKIITSSSYLKEEKELQAGLKIYSILSSVLDDISSQEDVEFILENIDSLTATCSTAYSDFCTVTDLSHPVYPKEITYVVGCSGRNYPAIPKMTGLFDEAYVSKIDGYPRLAERHHAYMDQLEWVHHSASHIIYSYATNDYQGREIQLAFEIQQKCNSEKPWPLITTNYKNRIVEHSLDSTVSNALFKDENDRIHGSISSIEKFFVCPYSYFIASGLKVRDDSYSELDAAPIGTLSHAVMESAVNKYGKEYPSMTRSEIDQILEPYFDELSLIDPMNSELHELTRKRLLDVLENNMKYLKIMEEDTIFKPVQAEHDFETDYFDGIHLRGTIDRIDAVNGKFRVLDYKSSTHSLSPSDILAGTQLQLLTYLLIATTERSEEPDGTYYFSMKEVNKKMRAYNEYKFSRDKITHERAIDKTELNENTYLNTLLETRKLIGWGLNEDKESLYENYGSFYSPTKGTYLYPVIYDTMHALYKYFYDEISKGNISLEPVEGACTFCDYKSICHFNGMEKKKKSLFEEEVKFQLTKKKE